MKNTTPKGFAKIKTISYSAELHRYDEVSDLETYLGKMILAIPEQKVKDDQHELAILFVGSWLQTNFAMQHKINQAFLFDLKDRYLERIEIQPFCDRTGCSEINLKKSLHKSKTNNLIQLCKITNFFWDADADIPSC